MHVTPFLSGSALVGNLNSRYAVLQPGLMGETEMIRTTLFPLDRERVRGRTASSAALLTCLLAAMSLLVQADDNAADSGDPQGDSRVLSVLDGQAFKGEIGADDEPAFSDDVWIFDEGLFAAKACRECEKGEYWLRSENNGIRFRTETVCPDPGAVLVYTGLVKGDRIAGTFTWTVDRWYGGTEKKFWFEGKRAENAGSAVSQSNRSIASCSQIPHRRPGSQQPALPSIRDEFLRFP